MMRTHAQQRVSCAEIVERWSAACRRATWRTVAIAAPRCLRVDVACPLLRVAACDRAGRFAAARLALRRLCRCFDEGTQSRREIKSQYVVNNILPDNRVMLDRTHLAASRQEVVKMPMPSGRVLAVTPAPHPRIIENVLDASAQPRCGFGFRAPQRLDDLDHHTCAQLRGSSCRRPLVWPHLLLLGLFAPRVLSADRVHCAPSRTSYAPWRALGRARPQCAPTAGPKPISFILPARLYLDSQYLLSFERTNRYKPAASPKRPSVVPLATCAAVTPFARCGMAISPSVSYSVP